MSRVGPPDLSQLPAPTLVPLDYEAALSARIADLTARMIAAGIPFDTGNLETEPATILVQENTYRRMLDLALLNDATRSVMPSYAVGAALDQVAARFRVTRITGETDDRLRRRIMLSPYADSPAGTRSGYVFQALTADLRVLDAACISQGQRPFGPTSGRLRAGEVQVGVLCADDVADAVVEAVRARINDENIKPATDVVTVIRARRADYVVNATIQIPSGPDEAPILASANARLAAYVAERANIGEIVYFAGLVAALKTGGVENVVLADPTFDIDPGLLGIARCVSTRVRVERLR